MGWCLGYDVKMMIQKPTLHRLRSHKVTCLMSAAIMLFLSACQTTEEGAKPATQSQDQIEQLIRLGNNTRNAGDLTNAAGFYQRALSLNNQDRVSLFLLGDTLKELKDRQGVERLYANALGQAPDDVELLRRYGNALVELDKLPQALIQFQKGLSLKPDNAQMLNSLGVAYDLQGRHDEAQSQYAKSIALNPNDLATLNNLALSLALNENYDKAIDLLAPYGSDTTVAPRYRMNLALIYGLKGDKTNAAKIAGLILDRESVENNLKVYNDLRNMSQNARTKAVLGQ
jgi:Flp pilus assembly protein TadD